MLVGSIKQPRPSTYELTDVDIIHHIGGLDTVECWRRKVSKVSNVLFEQLWKYHGVAARDMNIYLELFHTFGEVQVNVFHVEEEASADVIWGAAVLFSCFYHLTGVPATKLASAIRVEPPTRLIEQQPS